MRLDRREFLARAPILGTAAVVLLSGCRSNNENNYDGFSFTDELDGLLPQVVEESKRFPLIVLPSKLPKVEKESDMEDLPSQVSDNLDQYGIKSINFVLGPEGFSVIAGLQSGVRLGEAFLKPGTPIPIFIFFVNEVRGYSGPDGYGLIPHKPEKSTDLRFFFAVISAKLEDIRGAELVVHFNSGLFSVGSRELKSFSLPYRFKIPEVIGEIPQGGKIT